MDNLWRCKSCGMSFNTASGLELHRKAMCPAINYAPNFGQIPNNKIDESKKDPVKPEHYKTGGIQPIEYMRAKMSPEMYEGFLLGNVIKYISRYHDKNGLEDLRKAEWYLKELVALYEKHEVK